MTVTIHYVILSIDSYYPLCNTVNRQYKFPRTILQTFFDQTTEIEKIKQ